MNRDPAVVERGRYQQIAPKMIKIFPYMILLVAAWALKRHYSIAGSDELTWILWPVARVVEWVSTASFVYESGTGFVDHAQRIIIAPGCAGVNFMIVAFCMSGFMVLSISRIFLGQMMWLGFSAASAYLLTIIANTLRIVMATGLYRVDFYGPWVTPTRVHRMAGIVVYLILLYGLFVCVTRLKLWRPVIFKNEKKALFPFMWYSAMTIVIPLINGADSIGTGRFFEHSLMIIVGSAIVFLGIDLVHRANTRLMGHRQRKLPTNRCTRSGSKLLCMKEHIP